MSDKMRITHEVINEEKDDANQLELYFGRHYKKPFCINCRYCGKQHTEKYDWYQCGVDHTLYNKKGP